MRNEGMNNFNTNINLKQYNVRTNFNVNVTKTTRLLSSSRVISMITGGRLMRVIFCSTMRSMLRRGLSEGLRSG